MKALKFNKQQKKCYNNANHQTKKYMAFALMTLPFAPNALAPIISEPTLEFHYGKHHRTYVDNLNKLVVGTALETKSLAEIIKETAGQTDSLGIFNNAAQVFNHDFYWSSLKPGTSPQGALLEKINVDFGDLDKLKAELKAQGLAQFGSGWVWLVNDHGKLKVERTANADNPLAHDREPLLCIDVWEHAYYLDYQNRRADYLEMVINNLLNWDLAAQYLVV